MTEERLQFVARRKLAMLYAALEATLPEIKGNQLSAAIDVGRYGDVYV